MRSSEPPRPAGRRTPAETRPANDRARRLLTLATVLVAGFASVATSPPAEAVSGAAEGPRIELSGEIPEATVSVDIVPSPQAELAPDQSIRVSVHPVWSDFSGRDEDESPTSTFPNVGEVLELAAVDSSGEVIASAMGEFLDCGLEGCAGMTAVRFRLLDPSVEEVALNWSLEAYFFFGSDGVPKGAEVEVEVGELDGQVRSVAAEGSLGEEFWRTRYFNAMRIQIHAPNGVPPDAELTFEPLRVGEDDRLIGPERVYELQGQVALRLQPPARCRVGPCDWSLLLTGLETTWQLVADTELGIEAGVAPVSPVELESLASVGQLDLKPDQDSMLSLSVETSRSAVTGTDFVASGPLAAVELRITSTDPDLSVDAPELQRWGHDPGLVVFSQPVELTCHDQTCRATISTPLSFSVEDPSAVAFLEARAFVPYLLTGQVPEGAEIRLEVEQ